MKDLLKAAIKCSHCGKFRKHNEYTTALGADEDSAKPVCDTYKHPRIAKALATLDDVPVVAFTRYGSEEATHVFRRRPRRGRRPTRARLQVCRVLAIPPRSRDELLGRRGLAR